MRQNCAPPNITRSTKLWGAKRSPKLAFRSTKFRVLGNLKLNYKMYYKSLIPHKNRIYPYFQNKIKKNNEIK